MVIVAMDFLIVGINFPLLRRDLCHKSGCGMSISLHFKLGGPDRLVFRLKKEDVGGQRNP